MKVRRLLFACALAFASLSIPAAPANAASSYVVTGSLTIGCFGCGPSSGSLTGTVTGVYGSQPVSGTLNGTFDTVSGPALPAPACTATFTAAGTLTGAITAAFTLTYVFPGTFVVTLTTHGHVWVGVMAATSVNCLGVTVLTFHAVGVGVTF